MKQALFVAFFLLPVAAAAQTAPQQSQPAILAASLASTLSGALAENDQLRAQAIERDKELADLRAKLTAATAPKKD